MDMKKSEPRDQKECLEKEKEKRKKYSVTLHVC